MKKQFLLPASFAVIWSVVLPLVLTAYGTDPIVRQYLRNIDDKPLEETPSIQQTMEELDRGEVELPVELDRLFETPSFVPPDAFRGAELRRWRDNTGAYEVEARLTIIFPDRVRLTKTTGRTTTVAMQRLSQADQAYVRWVAGQLARSGGSPDQVEAQEVNTAESR